MIQSERELLRLIRLAYEAATGPEGWPPFLEAYARVMGGVLATLLTWQRDTRDSALHVMAGPHASKPLVDEYNAYFGARNPWMLNVTPYMRAGAITLSQVTYPVSELRKTEFYHDYLTRFDVGGGIGACLLEHDGACAHVSVQRAIDSDPCDAREVRFVRQLMPHLQRAIHIQTLLQDLQADHRANVDALDRLSTGVLLVCAEARVHYANRRAAELLAAGDGLIASADGLRTAQRSETDALRALIARAASGAEGSSRQAGGVMRVARPSQRLPLVVLVAPTALAVPHPRTAAHVVTVLLRDPAEPADARVILRALYGLTPAEARFADRLLAGETMDAIAEQLTLSRETARTYLKSVLRKTGTHRQAEFARVVTLGLASHLTPHAPVGLPERRIEATLRRSR